MLNVSCIKQVKINNYKKEEIFEGLKPDGKTQGMKETI